MTSLDASVRDELDSAVHLQNFRLVAGTSPFTVMRAIYSARLALFIHGITLAKRMCEVQPAVLIGESSTQLVMYSLDTRVR